MTYTAGSDNITWEIFYAKLSFGLEQACTTYGPRAKCGPRKLFIWPANPNISSIQPVCLKKYPLNGYKLIDPWIL